MQKPIRTIFGDGCAHETFLPSFGGCEKEEKKIKDQINKYIFKEKKKIR